MTIAALLSRLEALEARLDARRSAASAGQLALDLTAATASSKGSSDGQPCGNGWIARDKTCHKGAGGTTAPVERPQEARRSRPKETIFFPNPIEGPSGARLTAYTWQWTLEEVQDKRGETVEKRVSDWEKSIANVETGRNVVHQFEVEKDGKTQVVSAESALKLLGFTSDSDRKTFAGLKSTARTIARLRMAQHQLDELERKWNADWEAVERAPRPEVSIGEWRQEPWGRRRQWTMGNAFMDQIENSIGTTAEQEVYARLATAWKASQMEDRGWSYMGQHQSSMTSKLQSERKDLERRLQRAEAKLQQAARTDAHQGLDPFEVIAERLDALKRQCTTGYSCGSACISLNKECRKQAAGASRERISRLEQLARGEIKPRGIGVPKPDAAKAMARELRSELSKQQSLIKAERQRQKAAAAAAGVTKPKVIVNLRRAKPGGETGPDGHWYPGGAWMSEGSFVGAKAPKPTGTGAAGDIKQKPKGTDQPRVIRNKAPSFPRRPLKPKGKGLAKPTGLKKLATKNDEHFFGDDGYIIYPRPKGGAGLLGTHFEAAVIQRMTTEELNWATDQIKKLAERSSDPNDRRYVEAVLAEIDDDIERYGGREEYSKGDRWTAERQLTGVDTERYIAGKRFMTVSRVLGSTSEASKRREQRYKDPRYEGWTIPSEGPESKWVWGLNNVFRAVQIRRGT